MVVNCEDVWREISNYLDGDVEPSLKAAMQEHFAGCKHCTAILDGTRNVIRLYADEQVFTVPAGFHQRLRRKLADHVEGPRGSLFGWVVLFAAAGALAAGALAAHVRDRELQLPELLSQHSQPARRLPIGRVTVSTDGKTFHVAGCPYLHGKWRTVPAEVAVREGYSPCVRCMWEALRRARVEAPSSVGLELSEEEPRDTVK